MILLNRCGVEALLNMVEVNVLLYVIMFDILTGIAKGFTTRKLSSHIGLSGMVKHIVIIVMILFLGVFAEPLEIMVIFKSIVMFFTLQYLLSILENLAILGIPMPKIVIDRVKDLESKHERYDKYES